MQSLVQEGLSDRKLSRSVVQTEIGGIEAAVSHYGSNQTPHIIIIESHDMGDQLLMGLEQLAEVCDPGTNVVLIGDSNDIELYRDLMRRGISEYRNRGKRPGLGTGGSGLGIGVSLNGHIL